MVIKVGEGENVQDVEIGGLSDLLNNEDFSKEFTSVLDSKVGKAVEAYKEKGFKSAVEKEVEERLKAKDTKTPEQLRIEELENSIKGLSTKAQEKELLELRMKNADIGRGTLKENGLPEGLINFLVSEDAEKSAKNIEDAVKILKDFKTDVTQKTLNGNNTKVPGKTIVDSNGKLQEPGEGASKEEWKTYFKNLRTQKK